MCGSSRDFVRLLYLDVNPPRSRCCILFSMSIARAARMDAGGYQRRTRVAWPHAIIAAASQPSACLSYLIDLRGRQSWLRLNSDCEGRTCRTGRPRASTKSPGDLAVEGPSLVGRRLSAGASIGATCHASFFGADRREPETAAAPVRGPTAPTVSRRQPRRDLGVAFLFRSVSREPRGSRAHPAARALRLHHQRERSHPDAPALPASGPRRRRSRQLRRRGRVRTRPAPVVEQCQRSLSAGRAARRPGGSAAGSVPHPRAGTRGRAPRARVPAAPLMFGFRASVVALAVLAGSGVPAAAQAVEWQDRAFLDVNVSVQLNGRPFTDGVALTIVSYPVAKGPLTLDVGGGLRVWRSLGIGAGFTKFAVEETAAVRGIDPVPVQHVDSVLHVAGMWVRPLSERMDLAISGGPSFMNIQQDLVTTFAGPVVA